jgi:MinD-like ATPase involved in chromosome partitioning or flagellar assembly
VELPTYTSIWRIEKRLYKLYDFRLPMPLPVGQIAVFVAITVPYIVLLTLFGLPFNHTLFWLYVLPPGLLTWLATRPVLESKRLPELLISQVRYLGEPSTWCRMAPLAERDDIVVFGRVWRRAVLPDSDAPAPVAVRPAVPAQATAAVASPAASQARQLTAAPSAQRSRGVAAPAGRLRARGVAAPAGQPRAVSPAAPAGQTRAGGVAGPAEQPQAARAPGYPATRVPWPAGNARARGTAGPTGYPQAKGAEPTGRSAAMRDSVPTGYPEAAREPGPAGQLRARGTAAAAGPIARAADAPGRTARPTAPVSPTTAAGPATAAAGRTAGPAAGPAPARPRTATPVRLVSAQRSVAGPPPAPRRPASGGEQAQNGPGEQRPTAWRDHVTALVGGRSPGRPDPEREARVRAALPLDRSRLVVVLGCTVGAGQTVTTLMLADLLAGLRNEPVAALDLNPGPTSLTALADVPATTVSTILAHPPGAHVAHAPHAGHGGHATPVMRRGLGGPRESRGRGRLDVICQDVATESTGVSASLQHSRLLGLLAGQYRLTLADPGASAVAKVLAAADQLVLVAPASADAARAVSMTCEWLGTHGHGALAAHSIAMINGVSRLSVRHAEQAELVLRGRCRAVVRVPWDDRLAESGAERGIRASLQAPGGPSRLAQLHPAVFQAYTALAGVLISALVSGPPRRKVAR